MRGKAGIIHSAFHHAETDAITMPKTLILPTLALMSLLLVACGKDDSGQLASFTPGQVSERWTVINYWAIWCGPCREEIPELNALAREHGDAIRVLGVDFDGQTGDALAAAMDELDIQFPVLAADPQPALGIARPTALPTTLVIAPDGRLSEVLLGPQSADSLLRATIGQRETAP